MSRMRFATHLAGLSVEQAVGLPRLASQLIIGRRPALAVAGLVALVAVGCLPAPLPGTAARATGFPTGDPPPPDLTRAAPASDVLREPRIEVIEGCFGPFDALMP